MRLNRSEQFDQGRPPWLHCISRCVRRAFLCGDGFEHRKAWIERRLRVLARCFQVEVGAYAVMSNHIHVVARPHPERVSELSAEDIARAWWFLRHNIDPYDLRATDEAGALPQPVDEGLIAHLASDLSFIGRWRERLGTISEFMRQLKEPLARMANKEDECSGAFWEGRFKSVPLLDVRAVVTCMAYVDLNPIRAQLAAYPEASEHTSVKMRCEDRTARQQIKQLRSSGQRREAQQIITQRQLQTNAATIMIGDRRRTVSDERRWSSWLTPVEDMTQAYDIPNDPGIKLDQYLALVEEVGRIKRVGKAGAIADSSRALLERLDLDVEAWLQTVSQPRGLKGIALGAWQAIKAEAQRQGKRWLACTSPVFRRRKAPEGSGPPVSPGAA